MTGSPILRKIAFLLILSLFGTPAFAKCPSWVTGLAGTYVGVITYDATPEREDKVTTELHVTPNCTLSGNYTFDDNGVEQTGILGNGKAKPNRVLTINWADAYGKGTIEWAFAEATPSFTGKWFSDHSYQGTWNGFKDP